MKILIALALVALAGPTVEAGELFLPTRPPKSAKTNEDFEKARASMADAERSFKDGELKLALTHASAGYQLYPNSSTATVVAFLLGQSGRTEESVVWYITALSHQPPVLTIPEIEEALIAQAKKLAEPIGWLTVERTPESAQLTVDGRQIPQWANTIGLGVGRHEVKLTSEGFEQKTLEASVDAFKSKRLILKLAKSASSSPSPAKGDSQLLTGKASSGSSDTTGWVLLSTGAVVTIAGGVLLGLAVDAVSQQEKLGPGQRDEWDDLVADRKTFELAGWATGGVGLALVASAIVVLAIGGDEASGDSPVPANVTVAPLRGGASIQTGWRF